MPDAVIVVGLILGSGCFVALIIVVLKEGKAAMWRALVAGIFGALLVGLSIWSEVRIRFSAEGAEVAFETALAAGIVVDEVDSLAAQVNEIQALVEDLAKSARTNSGPGQTPTLDAVIGRLQDITPINTARLDSARRVIKTLPVRRR